jgi:hypothetical protein
MTAHAEHLEREPTGMPTVGRHDRVRVPDGRRGEVIGYYRGEREHLLVLFDTGGSRRYCSADLLRLGANT